VEETKRAIDRQRKILDVKFLYSEDSIEIFNYYKLLNSGIAFDTVLSITNLAKGQVVPQKIQHGQMAEDIEDSLYNLPLYGFTSPIETPEGWYIFTLVNFTEELLVNTNDPEDKIVKQAKIVAQKRKEGHVFQEYFLNFFKGRKLDVHAKPLKVFAVHLSQVLQKKKISFKIDDATPIAMELNDVLNLLQSIPRDTLMLDFAFIEGKRYSLESYILLTAFEGFKTFDVSLKGIFAQLNARTRKFIEAEILAMEGRKLGLDKGLEVIDDVNLWKDNYLYALNRNRFMDSVTVKEEEIRNFYNNNFKELHYPKQVNIIEILTDSLEIVQKVLALAKSDADFTELARQYNKRSWTKKTGGEYGYFPVYLHGEIGKIAANLSVGEIYGPIQTADGYSVIKCIGKKADYIEYPKKTYDEMKELIGNKLKSQLVKGKLNAYTAKLAKEFGFSINADVFKSIETTEINSFAVRHLGFGGQVTGVPLISPDNEWIDDFNTNNPQP
ncbi:MAG: peptidyl-prolyl cis-trans isomerase, partial [Ignavibacteriales bacterium]|nr:peptidyl-prolyl cis-trans isomerase [Ignavibacteriales bacterium]